MLQDEAPFMVTQESGHLKLTLHRTNDSIVIMLTRAQAQALAVAVVATTMNLDEDPTKH